MIINLIGRTKDAVKLQAKHAVEDVINFLGQPTLLELTIKFVSAKEIERLNKVMRGIDKPTDVLSFPNLNIKAGEQIDASALKTNPLYSFDGKNIYLGDCAICLKIAKYQAQEFNKTLESEVRKLVVHSVLHLLGYDHIKDSDYLLMHDIENKILGETDE